MLILRTDRPEMPRDAARRRTSHVFGHRAAIAPPLRRANGLTLVEVLVAAAILSIAALAALELLATSDAAALAARRQAIASVEAERALAAAATALRDGREPSMRRVIDQESGGETLAGCAIEVRTIRESRTIGAVGANAAEIPMARLIAEVTAPDGTTLAMLERLAPRTSGFADASSSGGAP
jgi:prepilin-type N-terminal cleavage/methylation domain-containing protein